MKYQISDKRTLIKFQTITKRTMVASDEGEEGKMEGGKKCNVPNSWRQTHTSDPVSIWRHLFACTSFSLFSSKTHTQHTHTHTFSLSQSLSLLHSHTHTHTKSFSFLLFFFLFNMIKGVRKTQFNVLSSILHSWARGWNYSFVKGDIVNIEQDIYTSVLTGILYWGNRDAILYL